MRELLERYKASIVDGIPETNLVLYCPALHGRGGTLYDRSRYANHGTITGATWVRLPSGLYVLSFNGTSAVVSVSDAASLDITTGLTIEAWVKRGATGDIRSGILNKWATTGNQRSYILRFADQTNDSAQNKIKFAISDDGTSANATTITSTSAYTSTSVFYHIVGTYTYVADGSSIMDLYVNGASAATQVTTAVGPIKVRTGNVGIGAAWFTSPNWVGFLTGRIGIPRIYSRALTAAEVLRHYTREPHLFGV